jgi:hypothetical protein
LLLNSYPEVVVLYLQAANYLNIKSLLDLTCQTVADMIKGKTPEEIRKTFNIKNDFTPEEEEEVRRENQWAFECISDDKSWICNWQSFSVSNLSVLVALFLHSVSAALLNCASFQNQSRKKAHGSLLEGFCH